MINLPNPNATDGIDDGLDVITEFPPVPSPGQPHLHVAFEGPGMVCFSTDIRETGPWTLVVDSSDRLTLTWDISSVPDDIPLFLNPGDGSPIINMREQESQGFIKGIYVITIDIEIDTTPPSPVTDFNASNPTDTTIGLTWENPSGEDFAGTLIVRSQNPITWIPTAGISYTIDQVVADGVTVRYLDPNDHSITPFTDTGLSPSTTYYYRAFAYDFFFNYSTAVGDSETALLVILSSFTATSSDDGVILKWRTEAEVNNLGFNVYRSEKKDGKYTRVNPSLIKGTGTDGTTHDYSLIDENVVGGFAYYYYIEDIDYSGKKSKSPILQIIVGQ